MEKLKEERDKESFKARTKNKRPSCFATKTALCLDKVFQNNGKTDKNWGFHRHTKQYRSSRATPHLWPENYNNQKPMEEKGR